MVVLPPGCLLGNFLWRFFYVHKQLVGDPGVDPELTGGTMCPICLGKASGSSQEELEDVAGESDVWTTLLCLLNWCFLQQFSTSQHTSNNRSADFACSACFKQNIYTKKYFQCKLQSHQSLKVRM